MLAARQNTEVDGFVIDVPLFFETSARYCQDAVCVVAVSRGTQKTRLAIRNGFREDMIEAILAAQRPIMEKVAAADFVIWNEGPPDLLRQQTQRLYQHFFMTEELDNTPSPAGDIPQETLPKPLPAPEETAGEQPAAAPEENSGNAVREEEEAAPVLEQIDINELRKRPLNDLQEMAEGLPIRNAASLTKSQLVFELGKQLLAKGHEVVVSGVMEQAKDNYAMLRDPVKSFRTSPDDIYLGGNLIKPLHLRVGQQIKVRLRKLRPHDKYLSAASVISVEDIPAEDYRARSDFERLTPLFPKERLLLENKGVNSAAMRVLDLMTPFGKGQRGLIVAPPRGGKTVLLKTIARSIRANYPEVELIVLLLDERPEEVTDFEETVDAPVFASTFDEPSRRHAQVSDLVIERAKRLVEMGRDVVILLDSLTRLARGYNANQTGGRIMSGGLGSNALEKPRKFFSAARNVEEGGSLTIIATCLVDTESRMDEVIFEEFKGTGNLEIRLDRELSERRIYPAISLSQSGTRNDDRLYNEQEFVKIMQLRRQLAMKPGWEGLQALLQNISKTQNNAELLLTGLR
ncbi:transcription termination factor Rho [Akkermansia muciniphila]|nr:transcription termination factor Rho [Akkermansia muciniphila]MBT9542659.1 transcription termination factor Rho [Akkermansia muciniphila]